jgi:hypothetical protein
MSPRCNRACKTVFRLQNTAIVRSYNLSDSFIRSGVHFASKVPNWVPISTEHLVNAPSHSYNPKGNTADINVKQYYIWTKDTCEDGSASSTAKILHINTRDILTVDWRRRSVQGAVQDVWHLIQRREEDITESEHRIADLSLLESKGQQ